MFIAFCRKIHKDNEQTPQITGEVCRGGCQTDEQQPFHNKIVGQSLITNTNAEKVCCRNEQLRVRTICYIYILYTLGWVKYILVVGNEISGDKKNLKNC